MAASDPTQKKELDECRRCELWERATQAVGGEGPRRRPALMLVGEQPGDEEDRQGRPFVGAAGRLLRELLAEVGVDPASAYVTNAVKHFFWEPRGKRRIHKTPAQRHIDACNIWLEQEIAKVGPRVIVALGRTALVAVIGRAMTLKAAREQTLTIESGIPVVATFHPSAALRAPTPELRADIRATIAADLAKARDLAAAPVP
jgi:uracil-DNA glycosylase